MIKILVRPSSLFGSNSYILLDKESKNCVIIDLGDNFLGLNNEIKSLGYNLCAVLLTHGHFDHSQGGIDSQRNGVPVWISENDAHMLANSKNGSIFGFEFNTYTPDFTFVGGQTLNIGVIEVKTLATPGHSEGSVCFIVDNNIFSGDTLFKYSYGRYDFVDGDYNKIKHSLKDVLFGLNGDYDVYPGHGEKTTLDAERKYNQINYEY